MNTDKKFHEQMLEVQKRIGSIKKDSVNPFFKSKYFDINSLLADIKPILNEAGLVVLQPLSNIDGRPALKTIITNGTEKIEEIVTLPEVSDPQKLGSAISYLRRYALQSLLALEAEDDDANFASSKSDNREKAPYTKVADVKAYQAKNKADMDSGVEAF
jgi:hypothetical protein